MLSRMRFVNRFRYVITLEIVREVLERNNSQNVKYYMIMDCCVV
jgi:hypothetical protein